MTLTSLDTNWEAYFSIRSFSRSSGLRPTTRNSPSIAQGDASIAADGLGACPTPGGAGEGDANDVALAQLERVGERGGLTLRDGGDGRLTAPQREEECAGRNPIAEVATGEFAQQAYEITRLHDDRRFLSK
jgi:hypothetical protein